MGRAKQRMELISNEKARYVTFQKRKKGLKKKTYELKTLCDVDVCVIIYGSQMDDHPSEAEIWPPNPDTIQHLIDAYRHQSNEDRIKRSLNLSNFFEDRNQKMEHALVKLRQRNNEATYSTWDDRYNDLSKEQLRDLEGLFGTASAQLEPQPISLLNQNEVEIPIHYPFNQIHQGFQLDAKAMEYSMKMISMNNNYYNELGGVSNSTFLGNPLVCYDPMMPGMLENRVVNNPSSPMGYYNPSIQTMSPYLQYLKMESASASSSVHTSHMDKYSEARDFR
ncbi:agamous-like MADS-box protein AGL82 [Actinidia eriantha]|uniref:agamous-like MADS-box protein AGL82 n=1 Tax=Actinidia eriantha TaxID=165200 RepID=UPI00258F786E|nr:agamous-like MADS-box protein AGL82 [Actinidia eriantha]